MEPPPLPEGTTQLAMADYCRNDLSDIRLQIREVDERLVPLLARRFSLVRRASAFKSTSEELAAPSQVQTVLRRVEALAGVCGGDGVAIRAVYRTLIEEGIADQTRRVLGRVPRPHTGATEIFDLMGTVRAMRRLSPRSVPREHLEALIRSASWGPTGANRQAFSFVVVTEKERVSRIADAWYAASSFYLDALAKGSSGGDAAFAARTKAMRYQRDHIAETPALIFACYQSSRFSRRLLSNPRRAAKAFGALGLHRSLSMTIRHRRWAQLAAAASIYPAVQNLLLSARALGLGATLTTWHLGLEPEFRRVAGLPRNVRIYAVIPVGYPLGEFGSVRRRPVEEILHWETWRTHEP